MRPRECSVLGAECPGLGPQSVGRRVRSAAWSGWSQRGGQGWEGSQRNFSRDGVTGCPGLGGTERGPWLPCTATVTRVQG